MALINSLLYLTWRRKSTLLGLILVTCGLGIFARLGYQQFIYLQAQNISGLSVFNEILLPLAGLVIACQLAMSLLASVKLMPSIRVSGQGSLLAQASISHIKILLAIIFCVLSFAFWPLLNFIMIGLLLAVYSDIDLLRLTLTVFGLLLINWTLSLVIIAICLRASSTLLAIIQSILVISILLTVEASMGLMTNDNGNAIFVWQGVLKPFINLREGVLVYADIVSYAGWLIILVSLCHLMVNLSWRQIDILTKLSLSFGLVIVFASGYVPGQLDLTFNKRSSLTQSLKEKLEKIDGELLITAVINDQTSRSEVLRGYNIIKRVRPNSEIDFRSRQSLGPELKHAGEYIQFKIGELQQAIAYPFEQDVKQVFESAILQMLKRKQQWIIFIEGHEEASPFAQKSSDLGEFYQALKSAGWPIAAQNLTQMPVISDNTGLLVIASSKQPWLAGEINIVLDYLNRGGHLLLLADPNSFVAEAIETFIGITRLPGTLVDWNGYQSGTPHPAVVIINSKTRYSKTSHPVVSHLSSLIAFPWSSGLKRIDMPEEADVVYQAILNTNKNVWSEFDIDAEKISFEQIKGELQQSFVVAMSRYNVKTKQKIIMLGDSHFASDSAINNYSNKQFALNLVSWLTHPSTNIDNRLVNRSDNSITPSRFARFAMNWLFSLILPLLILTLWLISRHLRFRSYK